MNAAAASPSRVLVVRTSRFARTAITCAMGEWPGASLRVIHQAGTGAELDAAGVSTAARIVVPAGTRITVASLLTSSWGWRALSWRPDAVVVQWWNPAGHGHEAVDRAALLLQPRGFHVVMEDGRRAWVPAGRRLMRPVRVFARRLVGLVLVVVVLVASAALWAPTAWRRRRERVRMTGEA